MSTLSNSEAVLYSFVERLEALAEEMGGLKNDVKEIYGEAKSAGFDSGVLRRVLIARKNYSAYRETQSAVDSVLEILDKREAELRKKSVEAGA